MNVIASLVDRPPDPSGAQRYYYARPKGSALAAHGLPTGIQRDGERFRAVIDRRHQRRGFLDVPSALEWRELALQVLAIPMHYPSNDPDTEAIRRAFLAGGLRAVGL